MQLRRLKATDKRRQQQDLETLLRDHSLDKIEELCRSSSGRQMTADRRNVVDTWIKELGKINATPLTFQEDESNQEPLGELQNIGNRDSAALTRDSAYISERASTRLSHLSMLSWESCTTLKSDDSDESTNKTSTIKSLEVEKEKHGDSSVKTNQSSISSYKSTVDYIENSFQQGRPDESLCDSTQKAKFWSIQNKDYMTHTLRPSRSDCSLHRMEKLLKDEYRKSVTLTRNLKGVSEMGSEYDISSELTSKTGKPSDEESVSSETSPNSSTTSPSSLKMDTLKSYRDAGPDQDKVSSATFIAKEYLLKVTHKDKCYFYEVNPYSVVSCSAQNTGEVKHTQEESNNKDQVETDSTSVNACENRTSAYTDTEINNLSKHSNEDNTSPTGSASGRTVTENDFDLKLVKKSPGRSTEDRYDGALHLPRLSDENKDHSIKIKAEEKVNTNIHTDNH